MCSKGHQWSSVDRPCQPSFFWIKFWHVRNPHYLRVFEYVSVSECATGPARESEVDPKRPQMEKKTNAPITPIRPLPGDSAPLGVNTTATRGGNGSHSRGGGGVVGKDTSPLKEKNPENPRDRDPRQRSQGLKSLHGEPCTRFDF